jgi:hypothetical protein
MKSYDATIDALTAEVDTLVRKIDSLSKARHRVTVESFDDLDGDPEGADGYGDGDSNPSLEADSNQPDDGDNDDGDGNYDDDEEEDDDTTVAKASVNAYVRTNDAANRPGALSHSSHHSAGLSTTAAVQPPMRHKFEALSDKIQREEGATRTAAMATARQRFPDVYRSYQDHLAGVSAQRQHSARADVRASYRKTAPDYEDLVSEQLAKGFSRELAGQRVAQLHGFRAFDNGSRMAKRAFDVEYEFAKRVEEIMCDDLVDATEATRRARKEDPDLFRALQRSGR